MRGQQSRGLRRRLAAVGLWWLVGIAGTAGLAAAPLEVLTRPQVASDVGASSSSPHTFVPFASTDGRFVVFSSLAANLVDGVVDDNASMDIFLRDTVAGTTELVSRRAGGSGPGNGRSFDAVLSGDGSTVAFTSEATDLVAGQSGPPGNLFVLDRTTGTIHLVSAEPGSPNVGTGGFPERTASIAVSGDGRQVVFSSSRPLTAGNPVVAEQVYRFDVDAGSLSLVSHAAGDPTRGGDADSWYPKVSADGGEVVFASGARDLVAGVANGGGTDVFLWQASSGTTRVVSHPQGNPAVTTGSTYAGFINISADGRWVLFSSSSLALLPALTPSDPDLNALYLWDRDLDQLRLVSHTAGNPLDRQPVFGLSEVSGDGRFVAFASPGSSLIAGQVGPQTGAALYLWDRDSGTTTLVSHRHDAPNVAVGSLGTRPRLSTDGRYVSFLASANDLVAGSSGPELAPSYLELYRFDATTGEVTLVSGREDEPLRHGVSAVYSHVLSADGRYLTFNSLEGRLDPLARDPSGVSNVFRHDRVTGATELVSRRAEALVPSTATKPGFDVCADCLRLSAGGARVTFLSSGVDIVAEPYGLSTFTRGNFHLDRSSGEITLLDRLLPSSIWWPATGGSVAPAEFLSAQTLLLASGSQELVAGQVNDPAVSGTSFYRFDLASGERTLLTHQVGDPLRAEGGWGPTVVARGTGSVVVGLRIEPAVEVVALDLVAGERQVLASGVCDENEPFLPTFGVSADGRWVVLLSPDPQLVPGQIDVVGTPDAFLCDRLDASCVLLSHVAGAPLVAAGGVVQAKISGDGSTVVLVSTASNLVPGQLDTAATADVFLWERSEHKLRLVSHAGDQVTALGGTARDPLAIDQAGRFVAYASTATGLVPGVVDANGGFDVFRYDRRKRANHLVSHRFDHPLVAADGASMYPLLADDGATLAFLSEATNLVAGQLDAVATQDAFVWEERRARTRLASFAGQPLQAGGDAWTPAISPDGSVVAFASRAPLVAADYNAAHDLFLYRAIDLALDPPPPATRGEAAGPLTLHLRASHPPLAAVEVAVVSLTPGACLVAPDLLRLDAGNWELGHVMTVTVRDDVVVDGPEACRVDFAPAVSDDLNLRGFALEGFTLTVLDDDASGDALLSDDFEDGSAFAWVDPGTL